MDVWPLSGSTCRLLSRRATRASGTDGEQEGFTLAELLVVVVIIGLIGGVAVVSWQKLLPKEALNTAIRNLSDVLHGTRTEAIARSRSFEVHYDIDKDEYWVVTPYKEDGTGLAGEEEDERRRVVSMTDLSQKSIDIRSVSIDDNVYTGGEVFVKFTPLGSSSHHTVVLHYEPTDQIYTLEVLALTGDIRFHQGDWEREPVDEGDFR